MCPAFLFCRQSVLDYHCYLVASMKFITACFCCLVMLNKGRGQSRALLTGGCETMHVVQFVRGMASLAGGLQQLHAVQHA